MSICYVRLQFLNQKKDVVDEIILGEKGLVVIKEDISIETGPLYDHPFSPHRIMMKKHYHVTETVSSFNKGDNMRGIRIEDLLATPLWEGGRLEERLGFEDG